MYNLVFSIGRVTPNGVNLLGTAFMVSKEGLLCTCAHVVKNDDSNLVIMLNEPDANGYQDTTCHEVKMINVSVRDMNPFADIAILQIKSGNMYVGKMIEVGDADFVTIGQEVAIWGFPHSDHGRKVLTFQKTEVGAKVIIGASNIKTKSIVLNIQCRPGQSGSPVCSLKDGKLIGMIIGSYAPSSNGGINLGGIDPQTLHQTTHAVSSQYIKEMI